MKICFLSILSTLIITFSFALAYSQPTQISDIKNAELTCVNLTKPEALVFKTTSPQKIWRTSQDREGRIKIAKALELGKIEIAGKLSARQLDYFKANVTESHQLVGVFDLESVGAFSLSVTSTFLPNGHRSLVTDHYNCSRTN